MAFEPDKITRQHVLDAVEKIELEGIKLRGSTGYDVIINDKPYPPKEIMRHAHKQMNGSGTWNAGGGEGTNKFLRALDFQVVTKPLGADTKPEDYDVWYPLVQQYCQYLAEEDYAPGTLESYGNSVQGELYGFLGKSKIQEQDVRTITKQSLTRILAAMTYNFTGILTFNEFLLIKLDRKYWALGFNSNYEDLEKFRKGNIWYALHYDRSDTSRGSRIAHGYFDQIEPGDLAIIKGYGGSGDLTVHYAGMVKSVDKERKVLEFYHRDVNLYKGKAPKGRGAGNWHNTIVPVRRAADIKMLFNETPVFQMENASNDDSFDEQLMLNPTNLILYGPPGTGKTYSTKAYALSLLEDASPNQFDQFCQLRERDTVEFNSQWLNAKKSEQIEFVTFHQSFAYEDFVQGIRPDVTAGQLQFDKVDGVFKVISDRARVNYQKAIQADSEQSFNFEQVLNSFLNDLMHDEKKEISITMRTRSYAFTITKYEPDDGRIKFRKQSGGTGHDLLVKNLKAIYEGTLDYGIEGLGSYYYPFVDELKAHASKLESKTEVVPLKQYVLIIDEINRANISRVLGELITLLEPDKRLGQADELTVKLPSGEPFGVPPNLHIIGTMNTADKSIAHLDVALRRRFKFLPMYPVAEKAGEFEALLNQLNEEIEEAIGPEYTIGHSYFMTDDALGTIMNEKVIPLMMEYFNHDTEQVSIILNKAGLTLSETAKFGIPICLD